LEGSLQTAWSVTLFDVWSPTNIDRSLFLARGLWEEMEYERKLLD
jgi:hypothetical protein